jgi:Cyclic GMP-AMP synthase DncV-like, nucleotidyltransferase domain
MSETSEEFLSRILGCTVEQLDISVDDFQAAEQRYTDVGKYLADEGADVYVQGSFMLGTVVRPYGRESEYDLDLVCKCDVTKQSISQAELKGRVGGFLADYISTTEGVDSEIPDLKESRRCWTLGYDLFHMDVLPSIPNEDAVSDTAILLTDRHLRQWQTSDPPAYVDWFRGQCAKEFYESRIKLAKAAGSLDDVPVWRVRTGLHRMVQVLKRHRDVFFADDSDDKPPSSLITTLAARAYDGRDSLVDATLTAVQRMPHLVVIQDGKYWVPNPVSVEENFADKWNEYPARRRKFLRWRDAVEQVLSSALTQQAGAQAAYSNLERAFGEGPVRKALASFGVAQRELRESGQMRMTQTGLLGATVAGVAVRPNHRFYGGR